jgi:multidrug efflux pump subunit AcrA (membrane-fusion protein)
MFARGEITLGNARGLTLPQSAVLLRDGFHYVYRVEGDGRDGRVAQTKVVVGRRQGERIEIVSGIDGTMRVVESGVGFLADGDIVRVVEAPAGKTAASAAPAAPAAGK